MKSKILILAALFLTVCGSAQNTTSFRGNNQNTGIYEETKIKNPVVKWKCNLNGIVVSSPTISEGIAYVGGGDNNLYGINISNGNIKWKFQTNGEIASTPAVAKGMVYFTSRDGYFYAINIKTGKEKWKFKTEGEKRWSAVNLFGFDSKGKVVSDPWDFYLSSPKVENNTVYFGSGDSHIYALDAISGKKLWSFETGSVVHSSPAIYNGILYCGSWDSKLYAIDATTGKEIWNFQCGIDEKYHSMCGIQASPSVANGVVYFGSRDTKVYAVNAESGQLIWEQKFGGSWMPSSTAVTDSRVYTGSSDIGKFFALDIKNGNIIDSLKTHTFTFSSPAVSGNNVFIGAFNGHLKAFDKNTGATIWTYQTDASKSPQNNNFTPEGVRKDLYKGLSFKEFDDMEKVLGRLYSVGAIISSPVIHNGFLYFTSADGFLYAIKLNNK